MDSVLLILIGITAIVSYFGLSNPKIFDQLKFQVAAIVQNKEYYRMVSSALLHADIGHLFFNMLTLYFFAPIVIQTFGVNIFLLIYILAIIGGSLISLYKYKNQPFYSAIGASGGVTGILFAVIAIYPTIPINMMFIPIDIPGYIFAIAYLAYSIYSMENQHDNVGHSAHLGGAVIGLATPIILMPSLLTDNKWYIYIMLVPIGILFALLIKKQ